MTTMKKLVSMILAVMLLLSVCAVANAAEATYAITIIQSEAGHTYEAYQIFAGDLDDKGVLSNVAWGISVSEDAEGFATAIKTALGNWPNVEGTENPVEFTASAVAENLNNSNVKAFAAAIEKFLGTAADSQNVQADNKYVIDGLDAGYYLIKDKNNSLDGTEYSYTSFVMKVVKDTDVTPKANVPELEKKVQDIDGQGTYSEWQDSADWKVGEAVPFKLEGTVAANYNDYDAYKFVFHDKECEGLTFNKDTVVVKVNGTAITEGYEVVTEGLNDGCTFEVVFENLKTIESVTAGSTITVEYTSTLNEKAVHGNAGNPNTAYLEFSNNPNNGQGGQTGKTPEDKVVVFTYKVVVNKVDENDAPLVGAGFTLYKQDGTDENGAKDWVAVSDEIKGTDLTTFTWTGLDDGNYKLEETTTPAGYNTIAPIEFSIVAEHDEEADAPQLTSLVGGNLFTGDVSTGALTTEIENKTGAELPETGGIGTTIFYAVGGLLVVLAVVLLVTKRRMGEEN